MDPSECLPTKERRKIHTITKWLVSTNALPKKYLRDIHPSQVHRYKKLNYDEYFGNELLHFSENVLSITKQVAQHSFDRKIIFAYMRLAHTAREIFSTAKHFHKTLSGNKEKLVDIIQDIKHIVPVERCAQLLGISASTIRAWITQVRVQCNDSLLNLCRKVHPNQLLESETDTMKKLFLEEKFHFWPLRSLYYYALNNKLVSICESTWYKYARILNIKRLKPKTIKIYGESIRASKPNEYWHADVTYFKSADGIKNYIYTVVDNFSKFPLVVFASDTLCGKLRADTFRDALRFAIESHPTLETINLIVDGGSENYNGNVDEFLANLDSVEIKRIKALTDVAFSNSMAEAFNRTLKTCYLNHIEIANTKFLQSKILEVVNDFAYERPHGSLKGLTPYIAYTEKRPDEISFTLQVAEARKLRTKTNQRFSCPNCYFKS